MNNSRKSNSMKNMITSLGGQVVVILMQFICRTFFISCLSNKYLGVNGLFLNIINILSLSELGFGSALLYSMYKPIAERNEEELVQILNLFKKIYKIIATVIAILGIMLTPFLKYIIGKQPDIDNLVLIYWLFLLNTVVSYLWTYKKSIIEAHQQNYICIFYQKIGTILQNIIQIVLLLLTHNYILYLVVQVIFTILVNLLLSIKANRMYPYITQKNNELPTVKNRKKIYKNTTALAYHKFSGVILANTDNIIMSMFIGIVTVGIYSNYSLIINNLGIFLNLIMLSFTASIGNMGVTESKNRKREIFRTLQTGSFWIYGLCGVCLFNLSNPFIMIWLGKDYLLPMPIVLILVLNFYMSGMRRIPCLFIESFGIANDTKYKAVAETIINLGFSIILTRKYGLIGIFAGTLIASLSVFWREGVSLYKNSFQSDSKDFFGLWVKSGICFAIALILTTVMNSYFAGDTIINWMIKLIICVVIYNLVFLVFFIKSHESKEILQYAKSIIYKFHQGEKKKSVKNMLNS